MRRRLLAVVLACAGFGLFAQAPMSIKIKDLIICYAGTEDHPHYVAPAEEYLARVKKSGANLTNSAQIEVTYIGFESVPQAQAAFQRAVDIWSSILVTPMPVRIQARWVPLAAGVLGSANYTAAYANFTGAQRLNVFYPVAIAEKITGRELNDGEPDIFANFSSTFNWHFDPDDPNVPSGQYDLTTVVLHEIGHGLGFSGTFTSSSGQGLYGLLGTGVPIVYDAFLQNSTNQNLIQTFSSPSANLNAQLTGEFLFFKGNSGTSKIYAPTVFNPGSSISHLDEFTFNGTPDALMTPQIAARERIRDPGIAQNILEDLGWDMVYIDHFELPDQENINGPYTISATIRSDHGYTPGSVVLHYTLNGTVFTDVVMTPQGSDVFTADIPGTGVARDYGYYISVENTNGFKYVNPGILVSPLQAQRQNIYVFSTGPDTKAPKITHAKKPFLLDTETQLVVDAEISDNTGHADVVIKYLLNNVPQSDVVMTLTEPEADSIYTATLNFGALNNGDQIKYRIVAIDHAVNPNTGYSPSQNEYHVLNVVGLGETKDFYANDFESTELDGDFFGTGYTISQPAGFNNRAIHSEHPYVHGAGFPGNERELIYQLRYPIRVQAENATLRYDEIVLVEPGEVGSVFGESDFYDYVIAEGSIDGGETWQILLPGYDARANTDWLARYNLAIDANGNSSGTGIPSLYRPRTIDLLETFEVEDEVVIRFRMYVDQLAGGWGWSIDNVKIQIDDTPPVIRHNHIDYLTSGANLPNLDVSVTDQSEFGDVVVEYELNDELTGTITASGASSGQLIPFDFPVEDFSAGDELRYKISVTDASGNTATLPESGFLTITFLTPGTPVTEYHNDFNSETTDFIGNFFTFGTQAGIESGFTGVWDSYPLGFGLEGSSSFSLTLKKPITISASNPIIRFNEIVLVEGHANGIDFGSEAFNDYVVVEGSSDNGDTWTPFEDGYDAVEDVAWSNTLASNGSGTQSLFRTRTINMKSSGDFITGDDVLIRFRLFSNETIKGWGWAIDNLFVQNVITAVDGDLDASVDTYPNPATDKIVVQVQSPSARDFSVQLLNMQGQKVYDGIAHGTNGKVTHTIAAGHLAVGMYIVKVSDGTKSTVRKIIKRG